jgi:hypothetical protein
MKGSQVSITGVKINHDPTTTINNIMDTVTEMAEEASKLADSLLVTDYTNPFDQHEWHAISPTHDSRYNAVDRAYGSLLTAMAALGAAFNHSVNIDNR